MSLFIDREQVGVIRKEMNVTSSEPEVFVSITDTQPRGAKIISASVGQFRTQRTTKKIKVLFRPPLIKRFECP